MKNFARGWPSTSAYPSRDPSFVVQRIRVPFVDSFADVKLYEGRGEEENIRRRRFSHPGFLRGSRQRKICFFFFFLQKNFPDKSEPRHRISLETRLFPITTHYNVFWRAPLLKEK